VTEADAGGGPSKNETIYLYSTIIEEHQNGKFEYNRY
jgi:hypothetical protein